MTLCFFFLILGKQRLQRLGWTCGTDRALGCARAANRQWSHHILAQCRYVAHAHTWLPIGILENLPGLTGRSQNNPKIKGSRMTLKHQFPWNEGMKHPPWPWDQKPIGAQLTLHSFREAIRTLLALGALPRTLNADVWAEPRSGEIQISNKGWSCICHSLMMDENEMLVDDEYQWISYLSILVLFFWPLLRWPEDNPRKCTAAKVRVSCGRFYQQPKGLLQDTLRLGFWSISRHNPGVKLPGIPITSCYFFGWKWDEKKCTQNGDPGQSHGDSTSFGAICGLCLVANVNVEHTFLDTCKK